MVREDLVSSAVSFLQDPSVAASALDKRIAFLQSKNLTQEEVDLALARAGDSTPQTPPPPPQNQYAYPPQIPRQPSQHGPNYGAYPGTPWGPPPPPPQRDWRDWFIMATVTTGVGYGLYVAAQRYILPLITPPTPPQLEIDKSQIDASFTRAFALIDQLTTDTATLKSAEVARTETLDNTLTSLTTTINDLKATNTRREAESRIIADQVANIKETIPRALEGWKAAGDARLEEVSAEVGSLKRLLENRVGRSARFPPSSQQAATANGEGKGDEPAASASNGVNGSSDPPPRNQSGVDLAASTPSLPAPGITVPKGESTSPQTESPKRSADRRAAIPAWQMAAAKRSEAGGSSAGGEGDRA